MQKTYVARQAIFNRKNTTIGYELLFRDGAKNGFPSHISSERATYRIIVENFLSLGRNPDVIHSRCFINFTYKSLLRMLPLSLPKAQIVVEILEDCPPTKALLDAVRALYRQGYIIALDDFVDDPSWHRFMAYVHIIKVDIQAQGVEQACQWVEQQLASGTRQQFLAEKIETMAEYQRCLQAGFRFFQGYFFSQPEITESRYISPEQTTALSLFQEVCKADPCFKSIERIIASDMTLSYKLLKFVNNHSTQLEVKIRSFHQALVYLGQERLRLFVSLIVASYISGNKVKELVPLSMQRAQFCQQMSQHPRFAHLQEQGFLVGLLSLLDTLLDMPLHSLIEQLPLSEGVKNALLRREGEFGALLNLEEHFERANWQQIESISQHLGLKIHEVKEALMSAQQWSHQYAKMAS